MMQNILSNAASFLKTHKRKLITILGSGVLSVILICGIAVGFVYSSAKANINYNQDELQAIALAKIPGEVISVEKELDFDSQSFNYEFKIKDTENMLQKIDVNAKYGAIFNIDNNKDKDNYKNNDNNGRH